MWQKVALLAAAGAVGTLSRYGLAGLVQRLGGGFPWGTAAVNIAGTFLFGLLWAMTDRWTRLGPEARLVVLTGFLGAFTTFSTLMFETGQLLRDGQYLLAGGNLLLHNGVGILCLLAGLALGRAV